MVDETGLVERLDASIAELTARGSVLPPRIQEAVNAMDCARDALEALQQEVAEVRAERDALLQKPLDMAKMDSVDDVEDVPARMLAYYWWQQAMEARTALQNGASNGR